MKRPRLTFPPVRVCGMCGKKFSTEDEMARHMVQDTEHRKRQGKVKQ